jgi:plasmid stabilization system protein ParE
MRVRFLTAARDEFREGVRYYDNQRDGLGAEFREQVRAAVERIRQFPEAWHPLSERTRRCLVHRFPYGVVYEVRGEEILIVAVAHLHREPEYWAQRLPPA